MKLRVLELENVRRFAGETAVLGPFGDGLTTITAGNEHGKSTFFDALHALFFLAHSSKAKEVGGLQPYSGGPVSIAAVIDLKGKQYRIEKTFLQKPSARIVDVKTGRILHQGGEAESWISTHILTSHKGPTGLLWVRQGAIHVDPQDRGKDTDNITARRDLMSSIRGQIDAVTGGRRMDMIAARAKVMRDRLATHTIKAKAGGPWKAAEDDAAQLRDRRDKLQQDVLALTNDLAQKRQNLKRLNVLKDPERQSTRADQIAIVAADLEQARQSAHHIREAEGALQLMSRDREDLARQVDAIMLHRQRRLDLAQEIKTRQGAVSEAALATEAAANAVTVVQEAIAKSEAARRQMNERMKAATAADRTRLKWDRLRGLFDLLARLKQPQTQYDAACLVLTGPEVSSSDVARLEDLQQRISIAQQQRLAHFASVTLSPDSGGQAEIDGTILTGVHSQLIDHPLSIVVKGFGTIALHPAKDASFAIEDLDDLRAEFATLLAEIGFDDPASARNALTAREQAGQDKNVALAEIRGLAPDGVDALKDEWATLCAGLQHPANTAPPALVPDAGHTPEVLEAGLQQLDDELTAARSRCEQLQKAVTQAATLEATAKGLLDHQEAELRNLAPLADEDASLGKLQARLSEKTLEEATAQQHLAQLQTTAPNLDAISAKYERLTRAEEEDRKEISQLKLDLARIDGAIERQTESAVEEKLAEVEAQLEQAETRAARYETEAKAWDLLIQHLNQARKDAQDTYFEPIRKELSPLLAQIYNGAKFELDPEKILVGKITRDGIEDEVDVLSGGTYEQVAILTRLAFARLFARQGQHVPVILDDALVHSDDDRISAMFDVLAQTARDQQVIVLSCRTRAFDDLGGERASIRIRQD